MTVESALYPQQLNTAWPQASDMVSEGDNHIRLTKTVIKTTFPNVAGAVSATDVQLSYVAGVTSAIQEQINSKGAIAGQTWTGTHVFPSTTTIGSLTPTIRGYLETVTSDAQAQINARAIKAGDTYTGAHDFTGAAVTVPTAAAGDSTNKAASTEFVTGAVGAVAATQVAAAIHAATSKTTPEDADELGITDSAASWGLKKLTFANLKAWIGSLFVSKAGDTMTGPLAQAAGTAALPSYTFSGDTDTGMWAPAADVLAWSTAGAERLRIDTSGNVGVGTTPTAQLDQYSLDGTAYNGAATDGQLAAGATHLIRAGAGNNTNVAQVVFQSRAGQPYNRIVSSGGTAPFMAFVTNNAERMRIGSSGGVLVTGSGGLGYGVGSGGTATQATDRNTGVTINKPTGAITLFSTTTTAGTFNSFTLTNSSIAATDGVEVCFASGATANSYGLLVTAVAAGSCRIQIHNIAAVAAAEAPVIQFRVIKAATS